MFLCPACFSLRRAIYLERFLDDHATSSNVPRAIYPSSHPPSHGRYRFEHELAGSPIPNSKRRRGPNPEAPATNRPKIVRTDTLDAADTLRAISNDSSVTKGIDPDKARAGGGGDAAGGGGVRETGGAGGVVDGAGGETPSTVVEVLRDAMCGLCSELLLDAAVLPCSHSFCRLCWADHCEEKGTT